MSLWSNFGAENTFSRRILQYVCSLSFWTRLRKFQLQHQVSERANVVFSLIQTLSCLPHSVIIAPFERNNIVIMWHALWTRLRTTMRNSDWRYIGIEYDTDMFTENIWWFVWSETSYSGDEGILGGVTDAGQTNERQTSEDSATQPMEAGGWRHFASVTKLYKM